MYRVPKGITMKLHDHPKMSVISYVLKGSMQASIFNKIVTTEGELYEKQVKKISKGMVSTT